jgi:hypothetical protein
VKRRPWGTFYRVEAGRGKAGKAVARAQWPAAIIARWGSVGRRFGREASGGVSAPARIEGGSVGRRRGSVGEGQGRRCGHGRRCG